MTRPSARLIRISKFCARHLRHAPERVGLTLDAQGWACVDDLLAAAARRGLPFDRSELDAVVSEPTKRRYEYSPDGRRIRAVQGHSVPVDLGYAPVAPPDELFHGTHPGALDAIRADGLRPMGRRQVHLSADAETARQVGGRRGRAVVLRVAAGRMHRDGQVFFRAPNGVWLTGPVAPRYLTIP